MGIGVATFEIVGFSPHRVESLDVTRYFSQRGTNNQAEHLALQAALDVVEYLREERGSEEELVFHLFGDSKLAINQTLGNWGCKVEELRPFSEASRERYKSLNEEGEVSLGWIPREMNEDADLLSKVALHLKIETDFLNSVIV